MDSARESGVTFCRAGCRVSRWHTRRRPSEGETEVQCVGQEPSEASSASACAFCVDCEQLALFWLTLRGPSGCSICEDLFREMFWCVQCRIFTCYHCLARSALAALAQRDVEEDTDSGSNSCGSCEEKVVQHPHPPGARSDPAQLFWRFSRKGWWVGGEWAPTASEWMVLFCVLRGKEWKLFVELDPVCQEVPFCCGEHSVRTVC